MPKYLIKAIFFLASLQAAEAQDGQFADTYRIEFEELNLRVPNNRSDHSIDVDVFVKGKSGAYVYMETFPLGRFRGRDFVREVDVGEIKISKYDIEFLTKHRGGIIGASLREHQLMFRLKRYRTIADENLVTFSIPLRQVNQRPNRTQRMVIREENDQDQVVVSVTPVFY